MCVNSNTCHSRVYQTSPDLCVCHSRALRAGSARDTLVQSLAYLCTPRVYLLYSYCRLACACTILRMCSYIDTRVLVHCFACCCTSLRVCAEDSTRENFKLLMSGTVCHTARITTSASIYNYHCFVYTYDVGGFLQVQHYW